MPLNPRRQDILLIVGERFVVPKQGHDLTQNEIVVKHSSVELIYFQKVKIIGHKQIM